MGMEISRRRIIPALLGASALPLTSQLSWADQRFVTYAFPATGAPASRTMPDRLADIKNVLDFGADPTGVADSATAIQNAVNSLSGANRGTILFPVGTYLVNSSVTFNYNGNLSIHFLGADGAGSLIQGNFAGFLFDRHNVNAGSPNNTTGGRIFEKLSFLNSNTSGGCVRIGSTIGGAFRDCTFSGYVCATTEDSAGNSSQSIFFENCTFASPGTATPQECIIIGGSGAIVGCDFHDVDTAMRIYGNGLFAAGNRVEVSNTGYLIGTDSGGTARTASGFVVNGGSTEGCTTGLDVGGPALGVCSGFSICMGALGHDKSNSGYPLNTINSQYGMRIRAGCAQAGVFRNLGTAQQFDVAGISIGNASSRANLVFLGCSADQQGGIGVPWIPPTNAYTAVFDNCNIQPIWTFSQLPTGGNVLEGDEFSISDSTTNTWGANVTVGGGTNHVLVRGNGSNFTVVAK